MLDRFKSMDRHMIYTKFLDADGLKVRQELVRLPEKMVLASLAVCRSQNHCRFLGNVERRDAFDHVQAILFI